ncbi:MAG: PEP-CTERM sorting domain-containing protein [Anaerolineae bacterium]|nr:PEP-CTERM sorting domain-containing protein [Phycisphaerae bacterium]
MKAILAACAVTALGAGAAFGNVLSQTNQAGATKAPTQAGPPLVHAGGGPEADVSIPTVGINSFDAQGDAQNVVLTFNVATAAGFASGTPMTMSGIGWNNNITATSPSWLSDNAVYFDDNIAPDASGLFLTIGAGSDFGGTASFSSAGVLDLTDNGVPDISLPNGILRLEYFENFDDFANAIDGTWNSGAFTVRALPTGGVVPEPTSIVAIGLVGAGILGRRRRK